MVDRVAAEAPDTLLLAEAFWLMEGYFVRTLGMHRVYNSAFMNMLRDEDNAKYRRSIKNTLEFDPEVLKRFVNFMNNPDETTAVEQFGKGDKYFGVCVMMVTMPGLPMFGHGQIEGLRRKVRHGIPPRLLRRARSLAGRSARARNLAAAAQAPALRRRGAIPAVRLSPPGRPRRRKRLRLLERTGRRAGADRLSQQICRHARLDPAAACDAVLQRDRLPRSASWAGSWRPLRNRVTASPRS